MAIIVDEAMRTDVRTYAHARTRPKKPVLGPMPIEGREEREEGSDSDDESGNKRCCRRWSPLK